MDIISDINDEISSLRRLIYFLEHDVFNTVYKSVNVEERAKVDLLIKQRATLSVKEWIDNQRGLHLDTMSLIDLRQTAKGLGIRKADRYNKTQLITLILDRRKSESDRRPATS